MLGRRKLTLVAPGDSLQAHYPLVLPKQPLVVPHRTRPLRARRKGNNLALSGVNAKKMLAHVGYTCGCRRSLRSHLLYVRSSMEGPMYRLTNFVGIPTGASLRVSRVAAETKEVNCKLLRDSSPAREARRRTNCAISQHHSARHS